MGIKMILCSRWRSRSGGGSGGESRNPRVPTPMFRCATCEVLHRTHLVSPNPRPRQQRASYSHWFSGSLNPGSPGTGVCGPLDNSPAHRAEREESQPKIWSASNPHTRSNSRSARRLCGSDYSGTAPKLQSLRQRALRLCRQEKPPPEIVVRIGMRLPSSSAGSLALPTKSLRNHLPRHQRSSPMQAPAPCCQPREPPRCQRGSYTIRVSEA
jgi:hypothetical protein